MFKLTTIDSRLISHLSFLDLFIIILLFKVNTMAFLRLASARYDFFVSFQVMLLVNSPLLSKLLS